MKAASTIKIKAFIILLSVYYFLIEWPQLILELKFSKLQTNFRT